MAWAMMNESLSNTFTKSLCPTLCGHGERDAASLDHWGHPREELKGWAKQTSPETGSLTQRKQKKSLAVLV